MKTEKFVKQKGSFSVSCFPPFNNTIEKNYSSTVIFESPNFSVRGDYWKSDAVEERNQENFRKNLSDVLRHNLNLGFENVISYNNEIFPFVNTFFENETDEKNYLKKFLHFFI